MHMSSSRNVLSIVVDRELSGNARGLRSLPPRFLAGIDAGGGPRDRAAVAASRGHVGTGELLLQLDSEMPAPAELRKLIADLSARLGESASQREVFLCCGGDAIISRVLLRLCRREAGRPSARLPEGAPLDVINECTQILAELAMLDLQHAEALASRHELIGTLFLLMAEPQAADAALALSMTYTTCPGHVPQAVDAALTLAQELLSAGQDVFPLTAVPDLPGLIGRLSPRGLVARAPRNPLGTFSGPPWSVPVGLALVSRALAVLLAKSAEQG